MKSRKSAIENLKQFFSTTQEDVIPVQDAYVAWGRNLENVEGNKAWFSNKLTHMKFYNLVKPVYAVANNRRRLDKIQLTMEGKKALGRIEGADGMEDILLTKNNHNKLTIDDFMREYPRLKKENPEFNIVFSVTPKE